MHSRPFRLILNSGIWAPTLRFHDDTFWLVTTLVDDDRPQTDSSRWDNVRALMLWLSGTYKKLTLGF